MIDSSKTQIGRLGNWIAFSLECKGKRIEIISAHRMLMSSDSNGVHSSLAQYHLADAKVKKAKECRKEIFEEIRKHAQANKEINNVIIAGDYNQNIADKEVQKFHEDIGVKETHAHVNKLKIEELDKTYKNG